jgi:hypothetical protein
MEVSNPPPQGHLSESHFTTDGRSVSMSWCMFANCLTVTVLSCSVALSDKRSGLFIGGRLTHQLAITPPHGPRKKHFFCSSAVVAVET